MLKEPSRQTIKRRSDEPKFEIGDTIPIKDGVTGVVLARYQPPGGQKEVCYIVEAIADDDTTGMVKQKGSAPA